MRNSFLSAPQARTTLGQRFWGRSLKGFVIVGIGAISLFFIMVSCADDGNGAAYSGRLTEVAAYAGHSSIWVHWTAPSDNQFQGVVIEYTASGGSDRTTDIIRASAGQEASSDVSATNGTAYAVALYAVDKNGNRGAQQRAGTVTPGAGVAVICGRQKSSTQSDITGGAVANRNRNGGVPEIAITIRDLSDTDFTKNNHVWCLDAGRSRDATTDLANDLAQLVVTALGEMLKDGQPLADDDTTTVNIAQRQFTRASGSRSIRFINNRTTNTNSVFGSSGTRRFNFTGGNTKTLPMNAIGEATFINNEFGTYTVSATMP